MAVLVIGRPPPSVCALRVLTVQRIVLAGEPVHEGMTNRYSGQPKAIDDN